MLGITLLPRKSALRWRSDPTVRVARDLTNSQYCRQSGNGNHPRVKPGTRILRAAWPQAAAAASRRRWLGERVVRVDRIHTGAVGFGGNDLRRCGGGRRGRRWLLPHTRCRCRHSRTFCRARRRGLRPLLQRHRQPDAVVHPALPLGPLERAGHPPATRSTPSTTATTSSTKISREPSLEEIDGAGDAAS